MGFSRSTAGADSGARLIGALKLADGAAIEECLALGADPDSRDAIGVCALQIAAATRNREALVSLVRHGARPWLTAETNPQPPIVICASLGDHHAVSALLDVGAQLESCEHGVPGVLETALDHGHFEVAKLAAKNGANLNATDANEQPLLVRYCFAGRLDAVKFLLEQDHTHRDVFMSLAGASPDVGMDRTALRLGLACALVLGCHAPWRGANEAETRIGGLAKYVFRVGQVLSKVAEVTRRRSLRTVPISMRTKCVSQILDVNSKNEAGDSCLHVAVETGNFVVAELLLREGAERNISNANLERPTHAAVKSGYPEMLDLLMRSGANPNLADMHGNTPAHLAAQCAMRGMIKVLRKANANVKLPNRLGAIPIDLVDNTHSRVVDRSERNVIKRLLQGRTADDDGEQRVYTIFSRRNPLTDAARERR